MKVLLPGGSGQVGSILARAYHGSGHEVVVLSRTPAKTPWRTVLWDARTMGDWAAELEGADAVINLAGRSVNCRYTEANKRAIMDSRVESTRAIGEAIARATLPPPVWLQSSTATIYAHTYDHPNDEATGLIGGSEPDVPAAWHFSIEVAQAWEQACLDANTPNTRRVLMRSAMVMSPDRGGIFDTLLGLVRHGLGGTSGDGRQYLSWVHDSDFVRAVVRLIEDPALEGPVNIASPNPLPNRDFMRELRAAWGAAWVGLPAAEWMLELGARFMGSETELVLKSRRVIPGKLTAAGFEFRYFEWADAARDLCARWRSRQPTLLRVGSGKVCPQCGANHALPIWYGLPSETMLAAARRLEVALGGCVISGDDPQWRCQVCSHQWR